MTEKDQVPEVLAWLERRGTKRNRDGMARFAIPSHKAYGVSMTTMRPLIKRLGKNHELAAALWEADRHETRILAAFVDDPALVTPAQMDRWCRDFDSWAVCDTVCFHLFDRTPRAFRTVDRWASRRDEFVKRGAFALLASLALHDKKANDEEFLRHLPLIEHAASDERNFVKKAVNWALRQIRKAQPRSQCGRCRCGAASVGIVRALSSMGGKGRAEGAYQSRRSPQACQEARRLRPLGFWVPGGYFGRMFAHLAGLLDPRAKPENLCRLIPDSLPSGMSLPVFEGCHLRGR